MTVKIVYCKPCGYLPRATEMKVEIEKTLKLKVELEPGENGIYDVYNDDKLIFSKHKQLRFPVTEEIIKLLSK